MRINRVFGSLAAVLAMTSVAGVALAQSTPGWDGFYAGIGIGGASPKGCATATLNGPGIDPTTAAFSNCPSGGVLGGLQVGENFQTKRFVWGLGADFDFSTTKSNDQTSSFSGAAPPAGTYASSGKLSPKDFAILGARIGYGGELVFPYLRAGGVITLGSQNSSLSYTPAGTTAPVAAFSEGKNFSSTGWAAGGGVEIGLNGAWSITAEYLHLSLGKGSDSTTTCSGTAAACAPFAGISLDNTHTSFTSNIFRVGIAYWFNYWDKP